MRCSASRFSPGARGPFPTGPYKLDGNKITWNVGAAGVAAESPPMTISKLTDRDLVFEDVAGGKTGLTKK